jgi:hypothetical protein
MCLNTLSRVKDFAVHTYSLDSAAMLQGVHASIGPLNTVVRSDISVDGSDRSCFSVVTPSSDIEPWISAVLSKL